MQIIPSPRRVMPGNGVLRLGREITVSCSDTALAAVTGRFCSGLERRTGIRARVTPRGVKVLMSPVAHCYLDVPYAEQSADPAQARRRERVGLRNYRPLTLQESFSWEPVAALGAGARPQDVAGVEAAMWCETVRDFDDLTFALLPRLPGIAEKAWGVAASWADHRAALGAHGRIWHQDGLTFFRAPGIGWTQE